jgi:GDP-L-fucose synthase
MKILVTGSNGLLGTSLKKKLGDSHVYHTRKDANLINFDETFEYLRKKIKNDGVDTIIHSAAIVGGVKANIENNEKFFIENYKINNNVLKASFELKIPNFVNVLSTCIFPDSKISYPLTSDQIDLAPPHPSNYGYSYAKRLSGYETKIFRNINKSNWFSVVPTNLYGPNDNFNLENSHLIPGMIHRAFLSKKNDTDFVIWGDGSPLRQFVHSDDAASLIIWSLNNWNEEEHLMVINEKEYSVLEIAEIIRNKFDIPKERLVFDSSKPKGQFRKPAKTDIKGYDFIDLKNGIEDTIDWFIKNYSIARK